MEIGRAALTEARARYTAGDFVGCREALTRGVNVTDDDTPIGAELRVFEERLLLWTRHSVDRAGAARANALRHGPETYDTEVLYGTALYLDGRPDAVAHLERAREIANASGTPDERVEVCLILIGALYTAFQTDRALEVASDAELEATRAGLVGRAAEARWNRLRLEWYAKGNYNLADEFLALLDKPLGVSRMTARGDVATYLADMGRDVEARAILDSTPLDDLVEWNRGILLLAGAETEAAALRPGRAIPLADECGSIAQPEIRAFAHLSQSWSAISLGWAALPASTELPHAFDEGTSIEAQALEALTTNGREQEAIELFRSAAAVWSRVLQRLALRARWGAGEAMLRAGFERDGRAALQAASEDAREIGLTSLAGRIAASHHTQVRQPRSLTPREREVLLHVRQGATTEEIAVRLGIADTTVNRHVRNVLAKTGARTRRHAAALAGRPLIAEVPGLTHSQINLLRLLSEGATIGEAALLLHISRRTATRRLSAARRIMGLGTNASVIAAAAGKRA